MPQEYKSIFNNENSPNTLSINLNGQKYSVKEFDDSGSENLTKNQPWTVITPWSAL